MDARLFQETDKAPQGEYRGRWTLGLATALAVCNASLIFSWLSVMKVGQESGCSEFSMGRRNRANTL